MAEPPTTPEQPPAGDAPAARPRRLLHLGVALAVLLGGTLGGFLARELSLGRVQAHLFSRLAADADFEVTAGRSPSVRFPAHGPYDQRLGYTAIPGFVARLGQRGAIIESQARWTRRLQQLTDLGLFPVWREKARAGLRVSGRGGETLYDASWPSVVWAEFDDIPPAVIRALLFIENRDLLMPESPVQNPAVEWTRLGYAMSQAALRLLDPNRSVPGASTLATQLEKYRHARDGLTRTAREKLQQMMSASVRAYLDGPDTTEARRRIVVGYVNTLPLGAAPGFGEVHGIAEGLRAWFGADPEAVARLLRGAATVTAAAPDLAERGVAFKQVLALILGQRRPADFFRADREALLAQVDRHLRILPPEVVSPELRDAALAAPLEVVDRAAPAPPGAVTERKGADAVRTHLLALLGLNSLYALDRLDLTVQATVDVPAQLAVTEALRGLAEPVRAAEAGLGASRLLAKGDPARVEYSFTLFERAGGANLLRIHTDTGDGPFSLNDGMKLELGSTAKLRTLVTYLEILAELHDAHAGRSPAALRALAADSPDRLSRWVAERLLSHPGEALADTLAAAMERTYPASPREVFITGGGAHRFQNFNGRYDADSPTVREAFHQSINLPFVRMMRDLVEHLVQRQPGVAEMFADGGDPRRRAYLERFADAEGRVFLGRFWRRYRDLSPDDALDRLLGAVRPDPHRLAVVFRTVRPEAPPAALATALEARLGAARVPDDEEIAALHRRYAPEAFNLHDRGYIAGIHPLEMWLVAWLQRHPGGAWSDAVRDGAAARQEVYAWLLKTSRRPAQDRRIRAMLERDAFVEIHRRWQRLGYPFDRLVPSLATALGSSGDRPTALAELVGILSAGGVRYPMRRVERLHFAEGTPYETRVRLGGGVGRRVLPAEVAAVAREALRGVVREGTAGRAEGAFASLGLAVGGKTGTGDNRHQRHDRRGRLLGEEVRNRTATFAFFVGERWFGVVTAHVAGEAAADFDFTSALPVQVLRFLAPRLEGVFGS